MATREIWVSPKNEYEWLEFWNEFFHGEQDEKDEHLKEKNKHRKHRRNNRVRKQKLVKINSSRAGKHHSVYRLPENEKKQCPAKRTPKREVQRIFSPEAFEI